MRIGSTLYYVLKAHLGSASVLMDINGNTSTGANTRYYPFGEARFSTGPMLTDKLFTSQREITGLGIYHYGARFYSPKLGRFISPDTIIPDPTNPQSWNRFSYTINNPIRYNDPDGHCAPVCLVPVVLVVVAVVAVTAIFYATVPSPALMSDRKLQLLRPDPPLIIPKIYNNPKNKGGCLKDLSNLGFCALLVTTGVTIIYNNITCGQSKPCSNTSTATQPSTPTQTSTSTPTQTSTSTPTHTSTSTPTNIPIYVPDTHIYVGNNQY
jgi:RHS repeat-associated protein